ncbi:MAG TPA: LysR family transcriptional regulator [Nitrospirae bacterium]|nr:LysR family transcriptional regulator [Nitrospirota bacterium]
MDIKSKIWIEVGGEPVFGRGREALLKAIDRLGSINSAAKEIDLSYRRALSYIQVMEERLGVELVKRKAGGKNGGGAKLTKNATAFLKKYEKLEHGINEMLDKRFIEVFGRE